MPYVLDENGRRVHRERGLGSILLEGPTLSLRKNVPLAEPMAIVELELDSGVRRYSFEGASLPNEGWFQDKLLSVGTVYRESPIQPSEPRLGDSTFSVFDPELLVLKTREAFRNRTVRYRFGDAALGPQALITLYTAKVVEFDIHNGVTNFKIRDGSYDRFRVPLPLKLNRVDFPLLPADFLPYVVPCIYGVVTSEGGAATGAVPCYRIKTDSPFRYLVAKHVCKIIRNVYNYGTLLDAADWIATTITVRGIEMQCLDFLVDPKDPNRPNEFEITADVEGKMYAPPDDSEEIPTTSSAETGSTYGSEYFGEGYFGGSLSFTSGSGSGLIELPAHQLQDYLLSETGIDISELSAEHFNAAAVLQNIEGYTGSAWIGEDQTHLDVIGRWSISFMMPFFTTREGLYAISQLTANGIFGLRGVFPELNDENQIFRDSFRIVSNRQIASNLEYSYWRHWQRNAWQRVPDQVNTPELDNLGQEIRERQELYYVADEQTADRVAATRLVISAENQQFCELELPIDYHTLDLNDIIRLTHHFGLGQLGYQSVPFRNVSLEITLQPRDAHVKILGARNSDDLQHCDSHADQHADLAHGDAGHADAEHDDQHADVDHQDTKHSDTHLDIPHGDWDHEDFHIDTVIHADHVDVLHQHQDFPSPHADHTDVHMDGVGPHFDDHQDVTHADNDHADIHSDIAHIDIHSDTHGDVEHADADHQDAAHEDTEHSDYHCDTDTWHSDVHADIDHEDIAHEDGHGDSEHDDSHDDVSHLDSHSDITHADVPHSDITHADSHEDGHDDRNHDDLHLDHGDISHIDTHFDAVLHLDEHGDTHFDVTHADTIHADIAHADLHSDAHDDVHGDMEHADMDHLDMDHDDVLHSDEHADHNDVHHADA